ncbi:MAG: threonine--tRNA ligase, partial [Spirochaetia bacterium]|nr:threonine--tRNA ligase [Spirochaetia bacterium]
MRALYIHADYMEFEAKKKTPVAEEIPEAMHNGRMEEVLVAFITVEKDDEGRVAQVVAEAAEDIKETFGKVKAERVMLYPYAHLSNDLSTPSTGTAAMKA